MLVLRSIDSQPAIFQGEKIAFDIYKQSRPYLFKTLNAYTLYSAIVVSQHDNASRKKNIYLLKWKQSLLKNNMATLPEWQLQVQPFHVEHKSFPDSFVLPSGNAQFSKSVLFQRTNANKSEP